MAQASRKDYKKVLSEAMVILTDNLNPGDVLNTLTAKSAITAVDRATINAQPIAQQKVETMITLLTQRPRESYEIFMDVLKEKRHDLWLQVKALEGKQTSRCNFV